MKNNYPQKLRVVVDYLNKNRKRAVSQDELVRNCTVGYHDHESGTREAKRDSTLRQVRQIIRDLRIDYQLPILSSRDGYWFARNHNEVVKYVDEAKRRAEASAAAYFQTVKAFKKWLPPEYNQTKLDL